MEEIIKQVDEIKSAIESNIDQYSVSAEHPQISMSDIIDSVVKDDDYFKTIYEQKPFQEVVGKIQL